MSAIKSDGVALVARICDFCSDGKLVKQSSRPYVP